ncbi:segregation and condensation protein A [Flammeovirga kamogawensis]|uniref:Segregation and condensation protein A n=1 Tax=Flammeovirga kamogawensis TaxID=373891 RepID=A0ABX8GQW7_9BACT|nr:segregation/condensation protein A [Flammeovirga kamogawensis]MBB6463197.1 segregation and condensation protein A [Flammeovirga kamogawensis]QWG05950.1 segregation/condensation protein A [Flammeovirga kamogawensis]TRX67776.1 chromosome segregation protein ScpA [Flammeovirga kamogawensis]
MSFEINLPIFEGPFDLLLFFIQRDELDIHDIPIYKITNDFMEYMSDMERLNIELASDFIVVASTLMRIKAKMLLPRVEKDEEGNDIDPRDELVKHLLEYMKYKSVLNTLEEWEADMLDREKRGNLSTEIATIEENIGVETELQNIDLFKLLKFYQSAMKKVDDRNNAPRHQVIPYPYSQEDRQDHIIETLKSKEEFSFMELIMTDFNNVSVVFNFLAVLELLSQNRITIVVHEGFNNFDIKRISE